MRVLIVDDDPGLRQSLSLLLSGEGYDVAAVGNPADALARAVAEPFDLILCDVRMPGMNGLDFLRQYRSSHGSALIMMMSAYGGEEAAIAAMKEGAYDYLPKPFRSDEVILTLRKAVEREKLRGRVQSLEVELARWRDGDLVAESPQMRGVMEIVNRVAPHSTTVLITGESGTGKEVLARCIHGLSPRRGDAFVAVNCGAIPENLLESELFGHAKGSFTGATSDKPGLFEEADGGTLLLDEVGELPSALQVKLLRVLQENEIRRVGESRMRRVDVRLLAATSRNLEEDMRSGAFREDLYYRLNVVRIHIPPLRERAADLEALIPRLLERATRRSGRKAVLSPGAIAAIRDSDWPGNVRELENAIERAVVLSVDGLVEADAFTARRPAAASGVVPADTLGTEPRGPARLSEAIAAAERASIGRALAATDGSRSKAAEMLGVSLRTLFYKIKRLKIPEP
jgi:two-component system response regulator AtoC